MDRVIVYPGQVPAVEDFLQAQKNAVVSAGWTTQAVMGPVAVATGLGASIDGSANLTIGAGSLTAVSVLDQIAYSVFGTDSQIVTKQGLITTPVVMPLAGYTPTAAGEACNVLVSAALQDATAGSLVLAYYNTNSPTTPYNGAAGSGTAQPTELLTTIALSFTAGAAAAAGSQTTPVVSGPNYSPLYVVTLTQGAAPTVAVHPAAPFLAFTLPQLTPGFAREQVFTASGSFTVPRGSTSVRVYVWGAGGGGGGSAGAGCAAGGGGGGGYARGVVAVTPGQVVTVTVGAGGTAGSGSGNGGAGGGSGFGAVTGSGGAGGSGAASGGSGGGVGGVGSGGSFGLAGLGGGAGVIFSTTSAAGGVGGAAFQSSPSGLNANAFGPSGMMPGVGGNGGAAGYAGGTGAAGLVIVEY